MQGPVITIQEREAIEARIAADYTTLEIAHSLGRPFNTIRNEIQRNGGMKNYCAQSAQKRYFEMKKKKLDRFTQNERLEKRVINIEKYLKFIIEVLELEDDLNMNLLE